MDTQRPPWRGRAASGEPRHVAAPFKTPSTAAVSFFSSSATPLQLRSLAKFAAVVSALLNCFCQQLRLVLACRLRPLASPLAVVISRVPVCCRRGPPWPPQPPQRGQGALVNLALFSLLRCVSHVAMMLIGPAVLFVSSQEPPEVARRPCSPTAAMAVTAPLRACFASILGRAQDVRHDPTCRCSCLPAKS